MYLVEIVLWVFDVCESGFDLLVSGFGERQRRYVTALDLVVG